MAQTTTLQVVDTSQFPFDINDIEYFVIEREDGTVVKFVIARDRDTGAIARANGYGGMVSTVGAASATTTPQWRQSLSDFCHHYPAKEPVFSTPDGHVGLWIADAPGCRRDKGLFDVVIDGGDVLTVYAPAKPKVILEGDADLVELMKQYVEPDAVSAYLAKEPKVLQIDWYDRKAPPLHPEFWVALAQELHDNPAITRVVTCCQGGHGRSGSALTALMMCYTDYSPLDAITHLRAVHCPRAIESTVQHDYLNRLATHLGRPANSHESYKVKDFRDRFLHEVTSTHAKPFQDRLKKEKD